MPELSRGGKFPDLGKNRESPLLEHYRIESFFSSFVHSEKSPRESLPQASKSVI